MTTPSTLVIDASVIIESGACLITADDRYHRKAKALPGIRYLRNCHG